MTSKTPPPPPDKESEMAVLRLRVHAAETALYAIEEFVRKSLLGEFIQPVVKTMHEINAQFPLGDDTPQGAAQVAINAVRAAMPQYKDASDDEIRRLFFREK